MYKMSNVVYRLTNGTTVKTLEEAKNAKCRYTVEYVPVYEEYAINDKAKSRRRWLY